MVWFFRIGIKKHEPQISYRPINFLPILIKCYCNFSSYSYRNLTHNWLNKLKNICIISTKLLLTHLTNNSIDTGHSILMVSLYRTYKNQENIFKSHLNRYSTSLRNLNITYTLITSHFLLALFCQKDSKKQNKQNSTMSLNKSNLSINKCSMIGSFIIASYQLQN